MFCLSHSEVLMPKVNDNIKYLEENIIVEKSIIINKDKLKIKVDKITYLLPIDVIREMSIGKLDSIIRIINKEMNPNNIKARISRIVGYYSLINNWNESKKEEHNARMNGVYTI